MGGRACQYVNMSGMIAILLTLVGYSSYLRDVLNGRARPHVMSWGIWTLVAVVVFGVQLSAGAGRGAWVTGILALCCTLIFVASLRHGDREVRKVDVLLLFLTFLALLFWTHGEKNFLAMSLLCSVEILAFWPSIRKTWKDPFSETCFIYLVSVVRHAFALLALEEHNRVTVLFSLTWLIANLVFSTLILTRRR